MSLISTADESYRDIIQQRVRANSHLRGYKSQLAKAARCHNSFISQVLSGDADLTLDQAAALCDFWAFDEKNSEHFLLLVSYARAATDSLREKLRNRILSLKTLNHTVPGLFQNKAVDIPPDKAYQMALYWSRWYHIAIGRIVDIPFLRTPEAIAQHLNLNEPVVKDTLKMLVDMNLIREEGGEYFPVNKGMMNYSSDFSGVFSASVRQRSIANLERLRPWDTRYASVHTLNKEDLPKLQELLKEYIAKCSEVTHASADKSAMVCLVADIFQV